MATGLALRPPRPPPRPNTPITPAPVVTEVGDAEEKIKSLQLLASNSVVLFTYGRDKFYPKPFLVTEKGGFLYAAFLVGEGPIGGYNNAYINDIAVDNDVEGEEGFIYLYGEDAETDLGARIEYKTGGTRNTAGAILAQTKSTLLNEAIADSETNTTFDDTYLGFAYVVLKVPKDTTTGFPSLKVDIEGYQVRQLASCSPFQPTYGTAGSRNLVTNSVDAREWGSSLSYGGTTAHAGNLGMFEEVRIIAGSESNLGTSRNAFSGTNASILYHVTLYWKDGTSGKIRVRIKDHVGGGSAQTAYLIAENGAGSFVFSGAAGIARSIVADYSVGEYNVLKFTWYGVGGTGTHSFNVGPNSLVQGEYVTVYGMQIEQGLTSAFQSYHISNNPVEHVRDLISNKAKWNIDLVSARAAADWCNDVIGGLEGGRREMGMTFSNPTKLVSILENIRAYTGCSFSWKAGVLYFIPYRKKDESVFAQEKETKSASHYGCCAIHRC